MKIPKGPKDPFEKLPPEFREAIDASNRDEIKARITKVMQDEEVNQSAKRLDLHVQEAKNKKDKLAAPYNSRKADARLNARVAAAKNNHSDATEAALALAEIEDEEATDNDLIAAKDELSFASSTYTDGTKANKLKIQYCLATLKAKGAA